MTQDMPKSLCDALDRLAALRGLPRVDLVLAARQPKPRPTPWYLREVQ